MLFHSKTLSFFVLDISNLLYSQLGLYRFSEGSIIEGYVDILGLKVSDEQKKVKEFVAHPCFLFVHPTLAPKFLRPLNFFLGGGSRWHDQRE